jgi:hypothetical protein
MYVPVLLSVATIVEETTCLRYKKNYYKIVTENAIMVPADKGKTTVIIYSDNYSNKVHAFLTENKFKTLQKKPS